MTDLIPVQGMTSAPHLTFAGEVKRLTGMPTFHASKIPDVATARHAIETGLLDMVGMTRAHMADPHIVQKSLLDAKKTSVPVLERPIALIAFTKRAKPCAFTIPQLGAS